MAAEPELVYNEEYFNDMGKSIYLTNIRVEMNSRSKQYEQRCEEITGDLLKVVIEQKKDNNELDLTQINWGSCEKHVGALVLRGNRCVLVRSLKAKWKGMRFPSVIPNTTESVSEAAIRAVVEHTGVDKTEARAIDMISPITVYAPHGDKIVMKLVVLYATEPPPPGALEDADMEDDESPYDWYTYPNAINRLDERSVAALRSLASVLSEAATVGVLPCKWGGVFGQELLATLPVTHKTLSTNATLPVEADKAPAQDEQNKPLEDNDYLSSIAKNKNADKLPVTVLSG